MKTRRAILGAVLALAACKNPNDNVELLPMRLGDHRRIAVENVPAEEHPEELKRRGLKRARKGIYQADAAKFTATVYDLGAQAVAFEMVQKWRPAPRKIAFHQGPFFIVLESDRDDTAAMNQFASALEGALKR